MYCAKFYHCKSYDGTRPLYTIAAFSSAKDRARCLEEFPQLFTEKITLEKAYELVLPETIDQMRADLNRIGPHGVTTSDVSYFCHSRLYNTVGANANTNKGKDYCLIRTVCDQLSLKTLIW